MFIFLASISMFIRSANAFAESRFISVALGQTVASSRNSKNRRSSLNLKRHVKGQELQIQGEDICTEKKMIHFSQ